jgi:hypothetical protein
MTTIPRDDAAKTPLVNVDSIGSSIIEIEAILERANETLVDDSLYQQLKAVMMRLHARVRSHHAADCLTASDMSDGVIPPEYLDTVERLREEHILIVGRLDRLIRSIDSLAAQPFEETEVFFLSIRELIATLRRHEAEENCLFAGAMWRDTGGES